MGHNGFPNYRRLPGARERQSVEQLGSNWRIMMTNGGRWRHRNKDDSVNRDDVFDTVSHLDSYIVM